MKKDRQYYIDKINEAIALHPKPKNFNIDFLFKMKARLDFKQNVTKAQFKALDNIFNYMFHGKKVDKSGWIRIDKNTGEIL